MASITPEGETPGPEALRRRLRLEGVTCTAAPDGRCRLAVELEWCGARAEGEASALDTHHGRVRGAAEAALTAALAATGGSLCLELVGVKAFRAFDGWVVVVRVLGSAGDRRLRLLGASSSDEEEGLIRVAAQAVLDATNRVVEGYARP